jgi:acyl-coenzyme A thioesterase PaaI-like protein
VLFTLAEFAGMGAAVNGLMDVFDRLYVVARDGRISYTARAKAAAGPFTASALVEPARHAACRAAALAGERIELEVPVRITDAQGTLCAEAVFTAVVRPRR